MLHVKHRDIIGSTANPSGEFLHEVLAGLGRTQKALPCRFFYDDRGSALFEEITALPEYYQTRAEAWILSEHAGDMAGSEAQDAVLIEFGSGSSRKTELLLHALPGLRAYVMIDVSSGALEGAAHRLRERFPDLDVRPVVGDFSHPLELDADLGALRKIGFFPGSTIGNLTPPEAQRLLRQFRAILSPSGRLIVGVDLKKDLSVLLPAYNDAAGVTRDFNLNLLHRINRELDADFDVAAFAHDAIYDQRNGRIEMHLVSLRAQVVTVGGRTFAFEKGETMHTENSYKYSVEQFRALAASAGWQPGRVWTDPCQLMSVHELLSD